ncbi:transporter substrate-binding domain-containing protein [Bosea sp. (in: a-proteobacteria)]|uniref:transporter substrate-binding domain-containing protein n=1 Tax=Bosea sp. (in: a-proteobacteria) TaxID=1871050 RepID=UPI00261609DD|nr:transporter substrate-binding domain-containing protein [Bosea sp. (in: a-proteobacteria)]MCO5092919.1 transporter substrate-binding domain-containing protein [Bosea sp. (in: a-proteobacteria)]
MIARRSLITCLSAVALAAMLALPAAAQAPGGTLDAILKRGKVLIGMDMSAPPFAYQDEKQQPAGSEVETARLIAKDLGVELEIVPTSAANRIPYLVTGRVDMMMGAFSIFPDRAKSVWFSAPYGSVTSVIMGPVGLAAKAYGDLAGKKISVSRGTYTEQVMMAALPKDVQIVRFDDDAQAMAAMASGQVDAYGVGNVPGSALIKRFPGKYDIKIIIPPRNWYSIGVRSGDTDLLQWLNTFVFFHRENGDLKKIYESIIGDTLPPPPVL